MSIDESVVDAPGSVETSDKHWMKGRLVAIRPDVPGKRFDPEDSNVLRTEEERAIAQVALQTVYEEARALGDQPPAWADAARLLDDPDVTAHHEPET